MSCLPLSSYILFYIHVTHYPYNLLLKLSFICVYIYICINFIGTSGHNELRLKTGTRMVIFFKTGSPLYLNKIAQFFLFFYFSCLALYQVNVCLVPIHILFTPTFSVQYKNRITSTLVCVLSICINIFLYLSVQRYSTCILNYIYCCLLILLYSII